MDLQQFDAADKAALNLSAFDRPINSPVMLGFVPLLWIASVLCGQDAPPGRVELQHGFYLVSKPPDAPRDAPLPLVICLHGTDTTAADILEFWRSFDHVLPLMIVAPQGVHAGWRDSDRDLIRESLEHMSRTLSYDPQRVLLTGHSAGGAMALHLLYVEGFPATAVAVTANYVPPSVRPEHIRARSDVPVFYAVGQSDINHERMHDGLALLREQGVRVTVQRPPIGHVLNRNVGQAAMTWFESVCRSRVDRIFVDAHDALRNDGLVSRATCALEDILRCPATQFPDQIEAASDLLARLQESGRQTMTRADGFVRDGRLLEARTQWLHVEQRYEGSSLAAEARRQREKIEAVPAVADLLRVNRTTDGRNANPDPTRPSGSAQ